MAELVKAGKVKYLGLSEASPKTIRAAVDFAQGSPVPSEQSILSGVFAE